jgi:uncharacterized protein (DUF2236 family)
MNHASVGGPSEQRQRLRGRERAARPYSANDPAALAWVHVTEASRFLATWVRCAEPDMTARNGYNRNQTRVTALRQRPPLRLNKASIED